MASDGPGTDCLIGPPLSAMNTCTEDTHAHIRRRNENVRISAQAAPSLTTHQQQVLVHPTRAQCPRHVVERLVDRRELACQRAPRQVRNRAVVSVTVGVDDLCWAVLV